MADREANHPVGCGYGLLGLCCDSCLSGPCRRSPFDDAIERGICGEDGDWIVANNLMERVLLESLQAMAAFRDGLERASVPESRIEAPRREEMRAPPLPLLPGRERIAGGVLPRTGLPLAPRPGIPRGVLDGGAPGCGRRAPAREARPRGDPGGRPSPFGDRPCGRGPLPGVGRTRRTEEDFALPEAPSPLLVIVADEKDNPDAERESLLTAIEAACGKEARIYRLPNVAPLPAFARAVFAKWGTPLSMTASTALVASSSMTRGLGALALGFSLVAIPGYPIGGSARVEGYLTGQMRSTFGHAYLASPLPGRMPAKRSSGASRHEIPCRRQRPRRDFGGRGDQKGRSGGPDHHDHRRGASGLLPGHAHLLGIGPVPNGAALLPGYGLLGGGAPGGASLRRAGHGRRRSTAGSDPLRRRGSCITTGSSSPPGRSPSSRPFPASGRRGCIPFGPLPTRRGS